MKALLFDFGGTLDTDGVHWSEKFWDAYRQAGVPLTKTDFEKAYVAAEAEMRPGTLGPRDGLRKTLEKQVTLQFIEARRTQVSLADTLAERVAANCWEDVRTTIGRVRPVLETCAAEYSLALVSNFYGNLRTVCDELSLSRLFAAIIDSTDVGVRKPDPGIFRIALDRLGTTPGEAAVVGDSYERDIVPGKQIGCRTVWLHGRSWKEERNRGHADYEIATLGDLAGVLRKHSQRKD